MSTLSEYPYVVRALPFVSPTPHAAGTEFTLQVQPQHGFRGTHFAFHDWVQAEGLTLVEFRIIGRRQTPSGMLPRPLSDFRPRPLDSGVLYDYCPAFGSIMLRLRAERDVGRFEFLMFGRVAR